MSEGMSHIEQAILQKNILCIQHDLWYSEFSSHRMLGIESDNSE
jgi:hypothetical protein